MSRINQNVKLMILMPIWSPMRHALFTFIDKRPDIQLTVLFDQKIIQERPTWETDDTADYDWALLNSPCFKVFGDQHLVPVRLPIFIRKLQPDIILAVNLTQAIIALLATALTPTRVILWTGETHHQLPKRPVTGVLRCIRRIIFPFLDGFACYSLFSMAYLKKQFNIPARRMFHLPQCIDTDHFFPPAKSEARPGRTTFLCVGALIKRKGIDLLLNSWAALPTTVQGNTTLIIAGTGDLNQELVPKAADMPFADIRFRGFVHYKDLPRLYQSAHVLVFPTREDIWGFVVNEAMASGLPVLCSTYALAREMVVPGKNGYTFDPFKIEETTAMIQHMCEIRQSLPVWGKHGQKISIGKYSVQTAAKALVNGIDKICRVN